MKCFIDLGCYRGSAIDKAIGLWPDCDEYIGFEPVPKLYKTLVVKFSDNPRVKIMPQAAATLVGTRKLYISRRRKTKSISQGSTLLQGKITGNVSDGDYVNVGTLDFSAYLKGKFTQDDTVILKMNIEGAEYDVLEHLVRTGAILLVSSLFCEWHVTKITSISQERHDALIELLTDNGFDLTGVGHEDGFGRFNG